MKSIGNWKPQKGTISLKRQHDHDGVIREAEIDVLANIKYPGVIISQVVNKDKQPVRGRWNITHVLTGYSVNPYEFKTAKEAIENFLKYLSHIKWDRPQKEIESDREAAKAHSNLRQAHFGVV